MAIVPLTDIISMLRRGVLIEETDMTFWGRITEKLTLMLGSWAFGRLDKHIDNRVDSRMDDRIEAWFRARAEKAAKEAAQGSRPQVETVPGLSFDPWSVQPPPDGPMGALFGVDPEKAKRDRLIKAMVGRAQ